MKKVIWIVVVVLVVLFISGSCSAYNRMVTAEVTVNTTWADVEAQYQRRSDLIPNLVNTVKGYAAHEQQVLTAVTEARAKVSQINVNADDAASLAQYQAAQGELSQALGRLMMVTENYPNLKADASFLNLQTQLEGTENRITVARGRERQARQQQGEQYARGEPLHHRQTATLSRSPVRARVAVQAAWVPAHRNPRSAPAGSAPRSPP